MFLTICRVAHAELRTWHVLHRTRHAVLRTRHVIARVRPGLGNEGEREEESRGPLPVVPAMC